MKTKGVKKDAGKPRTDLLSAAALMGVSEVLKFGAEKYAADNWRLGMDWRRLIGAMLRHALEFMDGQDIDPDSGLPTIDHVLCCAMFLSEYQKTGNGNDDRYRTSLKSEEANERKAPNRGREKRPAPVVPLRVRKSGKESQARSRTPSESVAQGPSRKAVVKTWDDATTGKRR